MTAIGDHHPIDEVLVGCYTLPTSTDEESDGTHVWRATTIVIVEVTAGGTVGLGYTYGHPATAEVVARTLAPVVQGRDALQIRARNADMRAALRNAGRPGIGAHAVSAVDVALWDLKARLLGLPLIDLLGAAREQVDLYGSGGFCNYTVEQLCDQLGGWVDAGIPRVKMKVGRRPEDDVDRVHAVRRAVGGEVGLMVDANGAYTVQQALRQSQAFADAAVNWHEEPVSSDDLRGLRHVRSRVAPGVSITAGEYAYDSYHVRNLIHADAVDCAQADVTRCGGLTGFLDIAALCEAEQVDLSAHCAPAISLAACATAPRVRHLEYFHDHVRLESRFFDGVPTPDDGALRPDRSRIGHGLELRRADLDAYRDGPIQTM